MHWYRFKSIGSVTTSGNRLTHWRPLVAKGHHELICVHMCLCFPLCSLTCLPLCGLHCFPLCALTCLVFCDSLLLNSQGTNTWLIPLDLIGSLDCFCF